MAFDLLRDPNHGNISYTRMVDQESFEFGGCNLITLYLDEFLSSC